MEARKDRPDQQEHPQIDCVASPPCSEADLTRKRNPETPATSARLLNWKPKAHNQPPGAQTSPKNSTKWAFDKRILIFIQESELQITNESTINSEVHSTQSKGLHAALSL